MCCRQAWISAAGGAWTPPKMSALVLIGFVCKVVTSLIRWSVSLCRASVGRESRGEEEDCRSSVQSVLTEWETSLHCPEKCSCPVKTHTHERHYCSQISHMNNYKHI